MCVCVCMYVCVYIYIILYYMYIYIYIWYTPPKISGTKFVIVMSYVLDISQTYHTISLRNPTHKKQVILIRFWNLWGCHVDLDMRECYTLYIYMNIYIYSYLQAPSMCLHSQRCPELCLTLWPKATTLLTYRPPSPVLAVYRNQLCESFLPPLKFRQEFR